MFKEAVVNTIDSIACRRLGLFSHVARLPSDVPANQILQICTETRDGERPSTTWTHQICRDTDVTAGGLGWTLRVTMMDYYAAVSRRPHWMLRFTSNHFSCSCIPFWHTIYLTTFLYNLREINWLKNFFSFFVDILHKTYELRRKNLFLQFQRPNRPLDYEMGSISFAKNQGLQIIGGGVRSIPNKALLGCWSLTNKLSACLDAWGPSVFRRFDWQLAAVV